MFIPKVDDVMSVALPNEVIRARVVRVVDRDHVEAKLDQAHPFTRLHGYGPDDVVRFERQGSRFGEGWHATSPPAPARPVQKGPAPRYAPPDDPVPFAKMVAAEKKVFRRSEAARQQKNKHV